MTDDDKRKAREIDQIVREVKQELNPDGRTGYLTAEAADLIYHKARMGHGQEESCGHINNSVALLARLGGKTKLKEHADELVAKMALTIRDAEKAAVKVVASGQRDFAEEAPGFDWVWKEVSLAEGKNAHRKCYGHMTFSEAKAVYDMLLRKGNETLASARRVKIVLDSHPEWEDEPDTVMSQILGIPDIDEE